MVDGTYITSTGLALNGSGPIAHVHTMMGFMRDDGAAFIGYPVRFPYSFASAFELTYFILTD